MLIVAGTNKDRKEINTLARRALGLEGTGAKFDTLNRVDMTQAERRYAPAYKAGMLIQPEKDYKKAGLMRGETYTVKQALPGNILIVTGADGNPIQFNPRQVTKLSVYKRRTPRAGRGRPEFGSPGTIRLLTSPTATGCA